MSAPVFVALEVGQSIAVDPDRQPTSFVFAHPGIYEMFNVAGVQFWTRQLGPIPTRVKMGV